ncbi:jg14279 [Pararge aegeria aegeria]|uniref:Jg14279 protein n=1 Tax=Pararge aegeria aegeria TaxID=348720 RepID=A0A8S4RWQ9_9NEOP|nr:jg14279 [Pararge aegeria aegeria]
MFLKHEGNVDVWVSVWSAWCWFHLGEYKRALDEYLEVKTREMLDARVADNVALDLAVCYFYLGMYKESQDTVENAPKCPLKAGDEEALMQSHAMLRDVPEDQLSLASVHYLRAHYQEAIDVYKKMLLERRTYMALNVYVALCYYKLDYYDVSQEVLGVYLAQHPTSTVAGNLKACNLFSVGALNSLSLQSAGTPDSFALLQLVANDSYRMGQFLVAAKAFHMLDRLDGGPEMWEGLRGAVCGCAQLAAANAPNATVQLRDAIALLRGPGAHPRAEHIARPIVRWAQQNRIPV